MPDFIFTQTAIPCLARYWITGLQFTILNPWSLRNHLHIDHHPSRIWPAHTCGHLWLISNQLSKYQYILSNYQYIQLPSGKPKHPSNHSHAIVRSAEEDVLARPQQRHGETGPRFLDIFWVSSSSAAWGLGGPWMSWTSPSTTGSRQLATWIWPSSLVMP